MDLRTVILMMAIGSLLFGLLLIVFKYKKDNPQEVPFWITAKMLQAFGSFLLYLRTDRFDGLTVLANIFLLLGCAYESWTIRILSGQYVKRLTHILTSVGLILICSMSVSWVKPYRGGLFFLLQSIFYFLPTLFLFRKSGMKLSLHFFGHSLLHNRIGVSDRFRYMFRFSRIRIKP